jgi:hypothetical protein
MTEHREYCHNCGRQIAEPSSFCSGCGATLAEPELVGATATASAQSGSAIPSRTLPPTATPQGPPPSGAPVPGAPSPAGEQPPGSSRNWIPIVAIGGVALMALGLVVVLLLTLGGSAGKDVKNASATREQALRLLAANGTTTVSRAAPGLFALVSAGKLNAAVPAGWRATAQAANGAARAEFADPAHPASTLTIVAQRGGLANDHRRALAARHAVSAKGEAVSAFGPIAFPGGRQAWRLTYAAAGVTHSTYFFSACNTHVAMVVDVAATSSLFQRQQASLEALAASAEPQC